jgi:uncharacterized protein YdaU (DUF1376 family)
MSRAWMPLYVADYLADTGHLTTSEHGAYMLLIMHYWQTGSLPHDDRRLARIARMSPAEWEDARDVLAEFFDDGWTHGRIVAEMAKAADITSKRKAAAEQRYSKRDASADANAELLQTQSQSQSQEETVAIATGAAAPEDPSIAERELFRRGREVLGKSAGGVVANLLKAKGGNVSLARATIEEASQRDGPMAFVQGAIKHQQRAPPKQDCADASLALVEDIRNETFARSLAVPMLTAVRG